MVAAGRFVQMRRGDSFQDGFQEVCLGCRSSLLHAVAILVGS